MLVKGLDATEAAQLRPVAEGGHGSSTQQPVLLLSTSRGPGDTSLQGQRGEGIYEHCNSTAKLVSAVLPAQTAAGQGLTLHTHCSCCPCCALQKAHEYTRALNAAKLERIFAKPFITSLTHSDGITCLARNPKALNSLLSGTADGEIRIWDIPAKRTLRRLEGHTGAVKGIAFAPDGETCVSCSTDCTVSSYSLALAVMLCSC